MAMKTNMYQIQGNWADGNFITSNLTCEFIAYYARRIAIHV